MYKIYYTEPKSKQVYAVDMPKLTAALAHTESLRACGMEYVTIVSDYQNMVGKPGVKAAGSECVPQMLN